MILIGFLTRYIWPSSAPEATTQNWFMWIGGIISAVVISANIIIPLYLGFPAFLSNYMVSQMVMSVLIDHFGLFGANQ